MGTLNAHKAISTRFAAEWGDTTPVAWPNKAFREEDYPNEAYARFYIMGGKGYQQSIGDPNGKNRYRATGLIIVQISTPCDTGDGEAQELADQAASIFRNKKFGGVWTLTPEFNTVGNVNSRFQLNVSIPWQMDEVL